jgi:hypothetical protein
LCAWLSVVLGCASREHEKSVAANLGTGPSSGNGIGLESSTTSGAQTAPATGLSSANLQVQMLANSCGANQAQDFFQVTNAGTSPVTLSQITIKLWVFDTSGSNVVPQINTGGCLTSGLGCYHQVSGVSVSATPFSPACGPDTQHQTNWEITISNNDPTPLAGGTTWSNIQTAIHLANYANFSPGTGDWYTPCVAGQTVSSTVGVYVAGNEVFSNGIAAPSCRSPHGSQQLQGYVTPAIKAAPLVGPVPGSTPVRVSFVLPLTHSAQFHSLVAGVVDPSSPDFGEVLTPDQFATQFGPSVTDYQSLQQFATAQGLSVTAKFDNRTVLAVAGTASQIEQAFFVNLNYRLRPDGTTFYALDREPSLNSNVALQKIFGLENLAVAKPLGRQPGPGSGFNGLLNSTDFRTAYASCAPQLTGSGQTLTLLAFSGFTDADINMFQPVSPPLKPVTVTHYTFPGGGQLDGGSKEITSDIELAIDMAPGLNQLVVYEAPDVQSLPLMFAALASPPPGSGLPVSLQVSTSWDILYDPNYQDLIDALVPLHISLSRASGDAGAYPSDQFPSINSNVTLVGGTRLTLDTMGRFLSDTTWVDSTNLASSGGGVFGAVSFPVPLPPYQMNIDMVALGAASQNRGAPDVSLPATNPYIFYNNAPTSQPGTSDSTPLWAGYVALINQQRTSVNNLPGLGFANPPLYAVAQSSLYGTTFNDINDGSFNLAPGATSTNMKGFVTGPGYDLATGFGSPQCQLIYQLASNTPTVPVCPTPQAMCSGTCTSLATDPSNCGGCGQDCGGGSCVAGMCQPVQIATQAFASSMALVGSEMYTTSRGHPNLPFTLWMDPTPESQIGTLPVKVDDSLGGGALATDGSYVYYFNGVDSNLYRASPTAAAPQLVGPATQPSSLTVAGQTAYWADAQGLLWSRPVANSAAPPTQIDQAQGPITSGFATDGTLFYFFAGNNNGVWLGGDGLFLPLAFLPSLLAPGIDLVAADVIPKDHPSQIDARFVCWVDGSLTSISCLEADSGDSGVPFSMSPGTTVSGLGADTSFLYFGVENGMAGWTLESLPLPAAGATAFPDLSLATVIATLPRVPFQIVTDATSVYVQVDNSQLPNFPAEKAILKIAKTF